MAGRPGSRNGGDASPEGKPRPELLRAISVGEIMSRTLERVSPETPLETCIARMTASGCRDLCVTDGAGRFLGVITPHDILSHMITEIGVGSRKKTFHLGSILSGAPVLAEDIMSRRHIAVNEETPLAEALRLLEKHHHPDIIVVSGGGILLGVVEVCSVLRYLSALIHPLPAEVPESPLS